VRAGGEFAARCARAREAPTAAIKVRSRVDEAGPRTAEGKAAASRNGWKGGHREMLRELARALTSQREALEDV
jgi:hypothetical protein